MIEKAESTGVSDRRSLRDTAPAWDNESGPEGASTPESGPDPASLDSTEERRLMPSMPRPTPPGDATPPPPNCPICWTPAIHWGSSQRNGVTEANYLCINEHGWLTKWVAA